MKKSEIVFYGICLLAGIFNNFEGGARLLFDIGILALAGIVCILVRNKYEKPDRIKQPWSCKIIIKNPNYKDYYKD